MLATEVGYLKVEKVHRAAVVNELFDPIIKPDDIMLPSPFKNEMEKTPVTPIFFVTYGDGKLLSSLIFEKEQKHNERN